MDITLIVNGIDLHNKLSYYNVTKEITYKKVVTTLDGTEHASKGRKRDIITFSLFPMTDSESKSLYDALSSLIFQAKYTDTYTNADVENTVRVVSNIESMFLLKSIDGNRRYRGGEIQLRVL